MVRLGYGVDRTGRFDPQAVERTLDAARRYGDLIAHHGAERIRVVATSTTRDASNRDVFIDGIRDILGVTPEVITGDEERSEEHTSELQSRGHLVCRLLLEKKKRQRRKHNRLHINDS